MAIASFEVFHYQLPFAAPLRLKDRVYREREGILLRLTDASGAVGWGEAAPLPGFSMESLDETAQQARSLDLVGQLLPDNALEPLSVFAAKIDALDLFPSVRFGLEGAILDLLAQRSGRTPPEVLDATLETVALNGLLTGEGDVKLDAQRMREIGYRAIKLKVGRRTPREDAALVRHLAELLGPEIELRLDANRAWSLDGALAFAEATSGTFAYLEEPLANPSNLPEFVERTGVPVALDETLVGLSPGALRAHDYARAAVLKPMLLGGIVPLLRMAQSAGPLGMKSVVSGTFESGVGLRVSLAIAAALGDTPAGLDTYRCFATDVLHPRLAAIGPVVDMCPLWRHHDVNPEALG